MKYFNQLDLVETEIIRLGELTKLYNVISNGANSSNREQIISAIGYIEGSLEDIHKNLAEKYPQYSFVFIGPIQADVSKLQVLKNIHFLGKKESMASCLFS